MSEDTGDWLGPVIELVDVVPVKQRRPVEGGRLFFTSVELWSHMVRWLGSRSPLPKRPRPSQVIQCEMRDDLGTAYRGAGGSDGGKLLWGDFSLEFEPAVPAGAGEIRLIGGLLTPGNEIVVQLAAGEPGTAT
jgi:hypothetical protein